MFKSVFIAIVLVYGMPSFHFINFPISPVRFHGFAILNIKYPC